MNKVILVGNLTRDPEGAETANGIQVSRFTVAVSRRFKNSEGNYDTDFINCVAWRSQADYANKYGKKGIKVGVVGTLQTRSYDADDGSKRYVTEVIADEFEILTPKNANGEEIERKEEVSNLQPIEDDTLPF